MLEATRDLAVAPKDPAQIMESYGRDLTKDGFIEIPAAQILYGRGKFSASMGFTTTSK